MGHYRYHTILLEPIPTIRPHLALPSNTMLRLCVIHSEDLTKLSLFVDINGTLYENPEFKSHWEDVAQSMRDKNLNTNQLPIYMQEAPDPNGDYFIRVLFPFKYCSYYYHRAGGVTHWCFQPEPGFIPECHYPYGSPSVEHPFFAKKLVAVPFEIGFHLHKLSLFCCGHDRICRFPRPDHDHYKFVIRLKCWVDDVNTTPDFMETCHFVCGNVRFAEVFEVLCGEKLNDAVCLVQGETGMEYRYGFVRVRCMAYIEGIIRTREEPMIVRDLAWEGNEDVTKIWFPKPCMKKCGSSLEGLGDSRDTGSGDTEGSNTEGAAGGLGQKKRRREDENSGEL